MSSQETRDARAAKLLRDKERGKKGKGKGKGDDYEVEQYRHRKAA